MKDWKTHLSKVLTTASGNRSCGVPVNSPLTHILSVHAEANAVIGEAVSTLAVQLATSLPKDDVRSRLQFCSWLNDVVQQLGLEIRDRRLGHACHLELIVDQQTPAYLALRDSQDVSIAPKKWDASEGLELVPKTQSRSVAYKLRLPVELAALVPVR